MPVRGIGKSQMGAQLKFYFNNPLDNIPLSNICSPRGEYFIFTLDDSTAPEIHMRVWDRKSFHYDNCAMAMITLFAVQTSEGWIA